MFCSFCTSTPSTEVSPVRPVHCSGMRLGAVGEAPDTGRDGVQHRQGTGSDAKRSEAAS